MIEQAFEVATEFRFDIGQAMLNTQALQGAVDGVATSAQGAMTSLGYLASGLVSHMGFGSGGLLSVLTKAVQVSEQFNTEALQFANNIGSNMQVLSGTIGTFNERLETSQMLMDNIRGTAIKFGLPSSELASITQRLASPLAAHGKLGTNYSNGISMAKNLMMASEATGIHPQVASESMARALTDRMALHGALFARLVNTQAFKSQRVTTQNQLINMNPDRKIDLLTKSLAQLGGDADFAENRLKSLSVMFTQLKERIYGALKPIGDAIKAPLKLMLDSINKWMAAHGMQLGQTIGKLLGNIIANPRELAVNLMQLRSFGSDFKKALHITEIIQAFFFLKWGLSKFGIELGGGLLARGFSMIFGWLRSLAIWLWEVGAVGMVFRLLLRSLMAVGQYMLPLLFFFQIISRAMAKAKIDDAINIVNLIPRMTDLLLRFKTALSNIFLPITMAMDALSDIIEPLFETSTWLNFALPALEWFAGILEDIGSFVYKAMTGLSGFFNVILYFVDDLLNAKNPFTNILKNYQEGLQNFKDAHPMAVGGTPTAKSTVTNHNHIEARFDMREQLEPDRIAFAVTEKLKKLAMNPTQGRGGSHSGAFANPQFAGGQ